MYSLIHHFQMQMPYVNQQHTFKCKRPIEMYNYSIHAKRKFQQIFQETSYIISSSTRKPQAPVKISY